MKMRHFDPVEMIRIACARIEKGGAVQATRLRFGARGPKGRVIPSDSERELGPTAKELKKDKRSNVNLVSIFQRPCNSVLHAEMSLQE